MNKLIMGLGPLAHDLLCLGKHVVIDDPKFIDSEIAPFAILGADNAETEKAIKDLEAEIGSDIDTHETGLYKQLKEAKETEKKAQKDYSTDFSSLESKLSDKATNKRTGIKYNVNRYGDQNYNIAKIKQEITVVTASTYARLSADKKANTRAQF